MSRKLLFIDRDGTLIEEPADYQVDRLDKLRLVPNVIQSLIRLRDAGYALIMVSNQDGLGSPAYPQSSFDRVQRFLLDLLATQDITFEAIHICPHRDSDGCDCRKPRSGLVLPYLRESFDQTSSAVVGDREADVLLAGELGVRGFRVNQDRGTDWPAIARTLIDAPRQAQANRQTRETTISVSVDLDDGSHQAIDTGIGFFDHMLESLARHGNFSLDLRCQGDLHVDVHHTVEDCALTLGNALDKALGERRGIARFGYTLPMDESLARAAIDLSSRPYLVFNGHFSREYAGRLPTEMVPHFFHSFSEALRMTLHLNVTGNNTHHMVESCFKATGRALREAFVREKHRTVPSTKGAL